MNITSFMSRRQRNTYFLSNVNEFQFKLQFRLRAFQREKCIDIKRPRKILCSSSKYGLTFIGCPTGVQCINTANIVSLYENQQNNRKYICDYPRRELSIGETPSHLDISSDSELLAVAITIQNCPVLYVYSVPSFGSKDILKKYELRLSNTSGVEVLDVQWNPRLQNILAAVLSDGSVIACEFKQGSYSLNTLPGNVQATCICWSPKGKQIVIGAANGTLSQYRPELKLVKSFPPPQLNNPVATVSVQWLSSFQFAAVYKDTANPSQGPVLIIVNVPKGAPINYVNYEGICFGSRSGRPEHFFIHQQEWNLLMVGCGNSMELGVLKQQGETPGWEQWCQGEANRAELPLNEDHKDVHTVGLSFDTSVTNKINIGSDKMIEPMPFVFMLSHEGVLCMFYAINMLPNVPNLCNPPQPLPDQSGLHLFSVPQPSSAPATSSPVITTEQNAAAPKLTTAPVLPTSSMFSSTFASSPATSTQAGFFSNTPQFFTSPQSTTGSLFPNSFSLQTSAPSTQQQGGPLQTPTTASKPTQSVPITIPSLQTSSAGNIATQPGNLWGSSTVLQTSSPSATQQTSGQLQGTPLFQQTGQKVTSATQQKSSMFQQTPAQHPLVPQVPNFQQNSTQQQQAFNSSQPQQAFNSSQPQQTFNSSQPQQAFNSSQPQLTFNSSQPQQALNSSQQSQSLNSQQQQQALNSSQSQQTFNSQQQQALNSSQQQQALNSSQQQQALNSQQQSMLSQHFSAQPQPMFHKTHSQTTDKDAPPQSSIQQEPLPLNNSPQQHPSPVLFQARQQKPQQLSSAKHKAIVPPSSPMVSSPQPPTPTGKSPSFKPPIDALQRTMEPQAFNFSLGQGKGGFSAGSGSLTSTHRKQDAVKATKIIPITLFAKDVNSSNYEISHRKSGESEAVNKVSGTKVVNLSSKDLEKKYRAGIRAEIKNFAAELKILKRIVNSVNVNIGDDEQKNKLKVQTENLESFGKDLRETTASQEAEVSALKVNLVETYNWFENIRGKHLQLTDSKYSSLKESNELDPISRQHIKSIEKNLTFLESNVRSIIGDLETMWTEKKDDYRKRSELETPTLETIFQSIMTIYKLINQQKMVVTGLENNLPLKMKKKLHHPDFKIMKEKKLHITGDTELSKLAEKLLNTKLGEIDDMNTSVSAGSKCFNKLPSFKHLTSTQEKKIQEWHKKYNGVHTVVVKKKTVTSDMLFSTSDESSKPVLAQNNIKFNELDQENGEIIFSGTPMPKSPMASLLPDNLSSPEMVNPVSNILHDTPNSFPKHPHSMKGVFSYNSQNKLIANVNEGISIDEPPAEGSGGLFNMAKHIHATPEKQISQNSLLPENGSMFIQNTVLSGIGQTDFNSKQVAPKLENSVTFSGANSPVPIKSGTTTTEPFTEKNASENTKLSFGIHNAGLKNDENKTMGKNEIKSLSGEGDTGIKLSDVSSGTPLFSNSIFSKQAQVSSSSKNIFTFPSSTTPASSSGNITLSDLGTSLATLSTSGVSQANEPSANKDSLDKTSSSFSFNFSSINTNQPLTKPLLKTPELTTVPSTVTAQQANTKSTSSAFSFARLSPNTNQKGNAQVSQPSGSMFGTVSTSSFSFGGKIAENSASSRQPPDSAVALKSEASTFKEDPASKPTLPISLSSETPSVPPQTPVVTSQSAISEPNKPAMPAFSSLDISSKSGGSFFGSQSSFVSQPTALLPTPTAGVDQKVSSTSSSFVFGGSTTTTAPVFGSSTTTTAPVLGGSTTTTAPVYGSAPLFTPAATSTASPVFASSSASTTTTSSQPIFGSTPSLTATTTSTSSQLTFASTSASSATTTSSQSVLANTPSSTVTTTVAQSTFGSTPAPTTITSSQSIFGSTPASTATNTTSQPVFGNASAVPTTTPQTTFGNAPAVSTTSTPLFGTSSSTTQPIFGNASSVTTTTSFVASTASTTTTAQSAFDSSSAVTTTTPSIFGSSASSATTTAQPLFGSAPTATTTSQPIFGSSSGTTFASPSKSTFGASTSTVNFASAAPTTTGSLFGSNVSFATPPKATTSSSAFGSSSGFGTPTTSMFGGANTFGTPSTSGGQSSFFGQAICSPATTSSSNVFGSQPTKNFFGQSTPASPTTSSLNFGSVASQPTFGQQGGVVNPFNQNSSAGNFGSSGGSLFRSVGFGSQNQQQSNLFQPQGGSNVFGGASSPLSGGSFSAGQSVSQAGFGSPPSFQNKPPAFGATGSPVFGSQPTFGSSPSFGGAATFGSLNKVFEPSPTMPQVGFGSLAAQPTQVSTFETLATQNTMTFGNLAQSQQTTGFFSQVQTTRPGFGGSSFNTWR